MLRFISLRGVWAHENVERGTFTTQRKRYKNMDRSRVVELSLQLETKQQIMQNNVETQHKHMY